MVNSPPDLVVMSNYEKLRLNKIRRNEARLRELGLDKGLLQKPPATRKKKANKKRNIVEGNSQPPRRSTRKRKVLDYREAGVSEVGADSDYDDTDMSTDDDMSVEQPRSEARRTRPAVSVADDRDATALSVSPGGLTLELAKTGRSTCRKCKAKIEKGSPRVGMQAWIVGRQATTWQCPGCFLGNLTCGYDASGRSRCKSTGSPFSKGELKVGARSHTATSFYKVDAFRAVIAGVLPLVGSGERDRALAVERVEGSELLANSDREKLRSVLAAALLDVRDRGSGSDAGGASGGRPSRNKGVRREARASATPGAAPAVGVRSGASGRVQWKFGGHICYGTLLPSKETKTHCYARTQKGNVKTLAKGKDYWSIIDQ